MIITIINYNLRDITLPRDLKMDKRKLDQFKKLSIDSPNDSNIQKFVNSDKINNALLDHTERMFDLEFIVKQKAQLTYFQAKQKKFQNRNRFLNAFSHEFLWSPTPAYYFGTFVTYMMIRRKY